MPPTFSHVVQGTGAAISMHFLKLLCLTFVQFLKWISSVPESIAKAVRQKRHQTGLAEQEAERLDRIRNPSKYLDRNSAEIPDP
jgi:hypothetical protein